MHGHLWREDIHEEGLPWGSSNMANQKKTTWYDHKECLMINM